MDWKVFVNSHGTVSCDNNDQGHQDSRVFGCFDTRYEAEDYASRMIIDSYGMVIAIPRPDGYRGELNCLEVIEPFSEIEIEPITSAHRSYRVVHSATGEIVGVRDHWSGNNGDGKDALDRFYNNNEYEELENRD